MVILLALHVYILSGIVFLIHDILWLILHEWEAVESVHFGFDFGVESPRIRQTRNRRQG